MVDFDANTPQLKAVKKLIDTYLSLDINNLESVLPKDYRYEAIPAIPEIPILTKESHIQTWKELYSLVSKVNVVSHELVEAPGKVIYHSTRTYSTTFGATYTYDCLTIFTLVEEDGELKVLYCKDFADPQQRGAHFTGTAKAASERVAA